MSIGPRPQSVGRGSSLQCVRTAEEAAVRAEVREDDERFASLLLDFPHLGEKVRAQEDCKGRRKVGALYRSGTQARELE